MRLFQCLLACLLFTLPGLANAASLTSFNARYQVIKDGRRIAESCLQLREQGDVWVFTTRTRGTRGLAGILGLDIDETSRFRWHDGGPEMLDYDYHLDARVRKRSRSMHADWSSGRVEVDNDGKHYSYATTPGLLERHLLALALAPVTDSGKQQISLPVAVKNRVEKQTFSVAASETLSLPAGHITATRITRSDEGKDFTAWYDTDRYTPPVKLQHGDYIFLLESYSPLQGCSD